MGSFCNSKRSALYAIFLCVFLGRICHSASSKLYVVYMGSRGSDEPEEILSQNHQMLTDVHKGRSSLSPF